jgi:hypothetical protein
MDNLNDLKAIWHTAKTDSLPNSAELMRIIRKFRNNKLLKKVAMILTLLALMTVMVMVMFTYKSTMLITRLGEVCIIISGLIAVVANMSTLVRFYNLKDLNNKDFILFLERTRQRQLFYHKRTQVAGLTFGSVGLLLYFFEFSHQNLVVGVVSYGALIIYLLVIWLILRPRMFKRQERKMKEKIEKFEKLLKQIDI